MNTNNPCAICGEGNPDSFRIWFDGYIKLYKCLKCGFIQQFPGPGKYTIISDYEDYYSLEFVKKGQEFMHPDRRNALQDILNRIVKITPRGKILDVGCGDGHFMYLCSKKGLDCYGVEVDKNLSMYAASKTNCHVIQGLYRKEMFAEETFDIVSFIQVIEHIPSPIKALEAAYHHLKTKGLLVLEVPSINNPFFIAYRFTGVKWFVRPPGGVINCHFGYYSPKTIMKLTEKCGFQKLILITGRWQHKYLGILGKTGKIIDPILNITKIGGILYMRVKPYFMIHLSSTNPMPPRAGSWEERDDPAQPKGEN